MKARPLRRTSRVITRCMELTAAYAGPCIGAVAEVIAES